MGKQIYSSIIFKANNTAKSILVYSVRYKFKSKTEEVGLVSLVKGEKLPSFAEGLDEEED